MKKSTHSKSKVPGWRKGLIWGFIFAFGVVNFGCEKDTDDYYIKYAAGVETIYASMDLDITYKNENNEIISLSITSTSWNITIGPVEKGFKASMSIVARRDINNTTLKAFIRASKNDDPFVMKASGESDNTTEAVLIDYTVDF